LGPAPQQLDSRNFTNYYYPLAVPGESRGIPISARSDQPCHFESAFSYSSNMRAVGCHRQLTNGNVPRSRTMTTYVARTACRITFFGSINN